MQNQIGHFHVMARSSIFYNNNSNNNNNDLLQRNQVAKTEFGIRIMDGT